MNAITVENQNEQLTRTQLQQILNMPCVTDRRVTLDTRGVFPLAFVGMKVQQVRTAADFLFFVAVSLP